MLQTYTSELPCDPGTHRHPRRGRHIDWRRCHSDWAAVGAVARRARADTQALREEVRADRQSFREEFRADRQSFREEVRADLQSFREEARAEVAEVRGDLADLRTDVQALTERMSRVEGAIEGLFAGRDRRNDAA